MDTVINRLSEIDEAANSIMEETNVRKKAFAQEIEKKTAAFDLQLEKETAERISQIRSQMEKEMQEMLDKQKADSEAFLKILEENYEKSHRMYVERLFDQMTKE